MEPKEGNREARGRLRQVGQRDTTPEMRWNSCSRPRLGSTPLERFRLWMKGGNDSFFKNSDRGRNHPIFYQKFLKYF